ncbi:MAG: SCO family protein [Deltaproteobacteria bacterium]|nr:SCO family protein [Deltaproteobacteria bacterium]
MTLSSLRTALLAALVVVVACAWSTPVQAEDYVPPALRELDIDQRIGDSVDLTRTFVDHEGKTVALADYFADGKPVLLTMNYYSCRMLCSMQLNAMLPAIKGAGLEPSDDYRIVTVSFDHREGPDLAKDKRTTYLKALGMGRDVDWSFLVGDEANIKALADEIGFKFNYDEQTDQFAHGAAVYFLSPKGVITRYLFGLQYLARDVRFAVLDAANGALSSPVDFFLQSCFYYDAALGSYVAVAWRVMRLGGVAIVLALTAFLSVMWRIEMRRRASEVI